MSEHKGSPEPGFNGDGAVPGEGTGTPVGRPDATLSHASGEGGSQVPTALPQPQNATDVDKRLAHLPPAMRAHVWRKGASGNPGGKGRQTAGYYVRERWNSYANMTLEQVGAVIIDPRATCAEVAAARAWVHACSMGLTTSGMPIAGADLDRIVEHTDGKAIAQIDVTSGGLPLQLVDRQTWDKV